jgi:hypothetical protein
MSPPTYCPTCGVPVAPGTQLCGNCGSSVHPTGSYPVVTAAPDEPAGRPTRRRRLWLVGVAVVLVVAGVAAIATRANADDIRPSGPPEHHLPRSDLAP